MCCAAKEWPIDLSPDGECPECGAETYEGEAWYVCAYSPSECDLCGWAPCDSSC